MLTGFYAGFCVTGVLLRHYLLYYKCVLQTCYFLFALLILILYAITLIEFGVCSIP